MCEQWKQQPRDAIIHSATFKKQILDITVRECVDSFFFSAETAA